MDQTPQKCPFLHGHLVRVLWTYPTLYPKLHLASTGSAVFCTARGKESEYFTMCVKRDNAQLNKSSAVAEMGDRGHNRHGPNRGGGLLCPFCGELGPRLLQCGLGRGLLPYQVASSFIQPFGHNRHEQKTGCTPLGGSCDPI